MSLITQQTDKYVETKDGMKIYINRHNKTGWVVKPSGRGVKLIEKGEENFFNLNKLQVFDLFKEII